MLTCSLMSIFVLKGGWGVWGDKMVVVGRWYRSLPTYILLVPLLPYVYIVTICVTHDQATLIVGNPTIITIMLMVG